MVTSALAVFLDRPLSELVVVVGLFAVPFVLGAGFFTLARWARRRNAQLKEVRNTLRYSDFPDALDRGHTRQAVRLYFFGDLPQWWEQFGRALVGIVILAVLGLFALVAVLILRAQAHV